MVIGRNCKFEILMTNLFCDQSFSNGNMISKKEGRENQFLLAQTYWLLCISEKLILYPLGEDTECS
jgi:hypothetical protein